MLVAGYLRIAIELSQLFEIVFRGKHCSERIKDEVLRKFKNFRMLIVIGLV